LRLALLPIGVPFRWHSQVVEQAWFGLKPPLPVFHLLAAFGIDDSRNRESGVVSGSQLSPGGVKTSAIRPTSVGILKISLRGRLFSYRKQQRRALGIVIYIPCGLVHKPEPYAGQSRSMQ